MSNETKRDVFEGLLESYMYSEDIVIDEISTDGVADRLNLGNIIASTRARYAAALPDDLPVIPEAVGNQIVEDQGEHLSDELHWADQGALGDCKLSNWIADNENTFARAWVLGVWKVKETGEIVKVEEIDDGD